jgi:dTDP-4-amino-4,6-dideoxygalactose transaminase
MWDLAQDRHIPLIFDAAHALGSIYKGRHVGALGSAEVFSASPTKLIAAGEGGIVGTGDDGLAKHIKIGRNYGDDGSADPKFFGLNARESEIHAVFGIHAMKNIEKFVKRRNELVKTFISELKDVPGLSFQAIEKQCRSTFKDLAIVVDRNTFGCDREAVIAALAKENIMTKRYFYPPLHRMTLMKDIAEGQFPNTDKVSQNILCLPIHSHMTQQTMKKICKALDRVQKHAKDVQRALKV